MKKTVYRMFSRKGVFYAQHNSTGKQETLGTKNRQEAEKLLAAKNAAENNRLLNLALAKVYISVSDPKLGTRTWKDVMDHLCSKGKESTRDRRRREMATKPLQKLRDKIVTQTTADDFFEALGAGTNYTNHALRLLHNLAITMGWLPWPLVPSKQWPKINLKRRRGVKLDEHLTIIRAEQNEERRRYYMFLWETGAAQTDAANMTAENVDWKNRQIVYRRSKTGTPAYISIGGTLGQLLAELPQSGPLFPNIVKTNNSARSAEFCRRLRTVGLKGISLHSYRYAWAERAYEAGYPERWAQYALGQKSRAAHQAYARGAQFRCEALEDWQKRNGEIPKDSHTQKQ
jgi:integrase